MSGPLYVSRKPENLFWPNQGVTGPKTMEPLVSKFTSFKGKDQDDWPHDNNFGKNEHLLRSGQLGMCNDPYCTTCPTYNNFIAAQQMNSKASLAFDPKVLFFLYPKVILFSVLMVTAIFHFPLYCFARQIFYFIFYYTCLHHSPNLHSV